MRLDVYLVEAGLFSSRSRARQAVEAGGVRVNGIVATKASQPVSEQDQVDADPDILPYVSRGGNKLEKAIRHFRLDFSGKRVLDVGASTGGFTDCALRHGARVVYAVDIGTEQLHPELQANPAVISFEDTDIRQLDPAVLGAPVDWIVVDASFISLRHILPVLPSFLAAGGGLVVLVKPQFEQAERRRFRGGIIRDGKVHQAVLEQVRIYAAEAGLEPLDMVPAGDPDERRNTEFLILLRVA